MNPMSDLPPLVEEDLYFLNKSILFTLYKGSKDVEPNESCETRWIHPCNNHLGKSKNFVSIWMILLLPGLFCFSIRNDIQDLKIFWVNIPTKIFGSTFRTHFTATVMITIGIDGINPFQLNVLKNFFENFCMVVPYSN